MSPATPSPPASPPKDPTPIFRPCIAELLRTLYTPPRLTLLIHRLTLEDTTFPVHRAGSRPTSRGGDTGERGVVEEPIGLDDSEQRRGTKQRTKHAYRLWLGDGELVIQAVLKADMHAIIATGEAGPGAYIRLDKYEVRTAPRTGIGAAGEVVYLAIHDFRTVGWANRHLEGDQGEGMEPAVGQEPPEIDAADDVEDARRVELSPRSLNQQLLLEQRGQESKRYTTNPEDSILEAWDEEWEFDDILPDE